jgi:hypothetical protein
MSNVSTLNPARAMYKQMDDLRALSAEGAYKAYYGALHEKSQNPCAAMVPIIKETIKYHMDKKDYSEETKQSYQTSIAEDLVARCNKDIFKVQKLAENVDDAMKARWRSYGGRKTKKSKLRNRKIRQRRTFK